MPDLRQTRKQRLNIPASPLAQARKSFRATYAVERQSEIHLRAVRPVRALVERHEGEFPTGALLRMWREMISSLVLMEMPEYSVAVYAFGEDQACLIFAKRVNSD